MVPQDTEVCLVLFIRGDVDSLLGLDDVLGVLDDLFCRNFDLLEL